MGRNASERLSRRDIVITAGMVLATSAGVLAFAMTPRDGNAVAVFAYPGGVARVAEIVADAGGSLLAAGGIPGVVIARSDNSDFVARLYASGAWLVLDGRAAFWCGSALTRPRGGVVP